MMGTAFERMDSNDSVEHIIAKHTQPLHKSIRSIELSIARMSGSFEEHKTMTSKQLGGITKSIRDTSRHVGEVAGSVRHHEAEIAELYRSKGEKRSGPFFQPTHLTLVLWLGLGLVVIAGAWFGVDVVRLWK